MVKGVARQVIVLKSPDPKRFEQAIFLLRENPYEGDPASDLVLQQAQKIADTYLLDSSPAGKRRHFLRPLLFALLGGGIASLFWGVVLPLF